MKSPAKCVSAAISKMQRLKRKIKHAREQRTLGNLTDLKEQRSLNVRTLWS